MKSRILSPCLFNFYAEYVCMLVAQSCLTLCDPMNCSPPGFSVHGIHQAIILEWIAIPFSRGTSQPRNRTLVSCVAGRFFTVGATGKSFCAEYIMRSIRLDESQAGIKIANRNMSNLIYADDTTQMAESEEELGSLLMVKEESEKASLKLNIQGEAA